MKEIRNKIKQIKALNDKMTFRGFYSDEQGRLKPLRAPPSVSKCKTK